MKKVIVFIICCLALILASTGDSSATAYLDIPNSSLHWKVEPLYEETNVAGIAASYYLYTDSPIVRFYDTINDRLGAIVYVGSETGDCGINNAWNCGWITGISQYIDLAYYVDSANYRFKSGYAYYQPDQVMLHFESVEHYEENWEYTKDHIVDHTLFPKGMFTSNPSVAIDANRNVHLAFVVDGYPDDYLFYAHPDETPSYPCSIYLGSEEWDCELILMGELNHPSIAVETNGMPMITYYDIAAGDLKLAYPSTNLPNCGPARDWRCISIDSTGDVGRYPSFGIAEKEYIAYYDYTEGYLKMAKLVSAGGNCGWDSNGYDWDYRWECEAIESIGSGIEQMGLGLVMDGADPVVAYMDNNDDEWSTLKLVQPASRLGMGSGNCGPSDPKVWYCQTIGASQYDLASELDLFITNSGSLLLAFLEEDTSAGQYHLWLARQYIPGFLPIVNRAVP